MSDPSPAHDLTDQEILALTQKLKEEEAAKSELVGAIEPLETLKQEYQNGSVVFLRKINYLEAQGFTHIRRLRGDGDCFFRSVGFAWLRQILQEGPPSCKKALDRLASLDISVAAFFDADIVQDFAEPLQAILKDQPSEPDLLKRFNDPELSNSTVVYLRLLASANVRRNADELLPFLFAYESDARITDPETGLPSVTLFCQHYIEAMSRDADHLAIQGLTQALGLTMDVAYFDQSKGKESGKEGVHGLTKVDFVHFDGPEFTLGNSILLLRPGHYDILSHVSCLDKYRSDGWSRRST